MSWFKREDSGIINDASKTVRTEGLWIKYGSCGNAIFKADLDANLQACPRCGRHFRYEARDRIALLIEGHPASNHEKQNTALRLEIVDESEARSLDVLSRALTD